MGDPQIPAAYILSRLCPPDKLQDVKRVLGITPVYAVVVSDIYDYELGREFGEHIIRTTNEDEAIKWALYAFQDTKVPSLVIGTAELLDQIYECGAREAVNGSNQI